MNKISMFKVLFLYLLLVGTKSFGQVTLDRCQAMARENYPMIRQYDLIEQTREYSISNVNKAYLPRLDVSLIGGVISGLPSFSLPGESTSGTSDFNLITVVQVNQPLWDGGLTRARRKVTEAGSEIERANLEVSLYALEERINNLFFGTLLIDEQVRQMDILRSNLERNRERARIAVQNGTAYNSDVDEIQVEVISVEQKTEELKSNRRAYLNMLEAMIGAKIDDSSQLVKPEASGELMALENHRPELGLFESQENLVEARSQMDRSMLYPRIGLLGFGTFLQPGVDFGTSTLDNVFVGGLSLNWSIDGIYTNANNRKLSELGLEQVSVSRETFLFNNSLELTQNRLELEKYRKMMEQDRQILELKARIKEAYELKYENGVSTMSELLDKTNEESVAQQNLIVHEIRYLMKAYEYRNKTGN